MNICEKFFFKVKTKNDKISIRKNLQNLYFSNFQKQLKSIVTFLIQDNLFSSNYFWWGLEPNKGLGKKSFIFDSQWLKVKLWSRRIEKVNKFTAFLTGVLPSYANVSTQRLTHDSKVLNNLTNEWLLNNKKLNLLVFQMFLNHLKSFPDTFLGYSTFPLIF